MGNVIVVILLCGLALFGLAFGRSVARGKTEAQYKQLYSRYMADGRLDREEIKKMLSDLPAAIDREMKIGAQCYVSVSGPAPGQTVERLKKVEYLCPKCSHKTVLDTKTVSLINSLLPDGTDAMLNLDRMRETVGQTLGRGLKVKLDESQLCEACSPGNREPHLFLVIDFGDGRNKIRLKDFPYECLRPLVDFINGEVTYTIPGTDTEALISQWRDYFKEILETSEKEEISTGKPQMKN